MDPSALLQGLATGALFGLSAGLSPGPLLALVIAQTLRHGAGHGVRVAMAPLITDVPIVVLCTAAVLTMTAAAPGAVALIALAGAVMVAWLARDTWRAEAPRGEEGPGLGQPSPRSWSRGALVNLLSPHPWLFWLLVGSPSLLVAWTSGGPGAAAAFLAGFYGCLVGAKVAVALIVARARGRVAGRGYRLVMRGLGVLLALFAAGLAVEGVSQVRQALGA